MTQHTCDDFEELSCLRILIDNIDAAILSTLFHRAQIIRFIIDYKKANNLSADVSDTRKEAMSALVSFAVQQQLRENFVQQVFEHLVNESETFIQNNTEQHMPLPVKIGDDTLSELNISLKHIDMALCSLLAERMHLVKQVGLFKKQHNIQTLAKKRWEDVLQSKMAMAESLQISPEAIRDLYHMIHEEALAIEAAC